MAIFSTAGHSTGRPARRPESHHAVATTLAVCFVATLGANTAAAQSAARASLDPRLGHQQFQAHYECIAYFNEPVARQNKHLQATMHDVQFSFPIHQTASDEWTFSARFKLIDTDTLARLPDTRDRFPAQLYDIRLSPAYRHKFDNDWTTGGNITIGSPSDKPFASGDEIVVSANAFLQIPHAETNAWLFYLDYSNNRDFLQHVPLPGFGYQFAPNEQLHALLGVPFANISWKPLDKLTLSASYRIPREVHAKIAYQLLEPLRLYAGFDWHSERYLRHDRRDNHDRLTSYEKRVMLGMRWDMCEHAWLDLAGGWTFDRFWYEGEDYGDRSHNRLNLSDGPTLKLQLGLSL